jgi:dTDP-4-dehydrorhamnose 3,5-epimerase
MDLTPLGIDGAWVGRSKVWHDARGNFREWFKAEEIAQVTGMNFHVAQANLSESKYGVLRGIHYSLAAEGQAKLVTCIAGTVKDVIVDIRPKSATFGKYVEFNLTGGSGDILLISSGLGHGFVSLEESSIVAYLVTSPYSPSEEFEINPLDSAIGINWEVDVNQLLLSPKDANAMSLLEAQSIGKLPT